MYPFLKKVTIKKNIFTIRDKILDNTNVYKYLGFTINKKGNFSLTYKFRNQYSVSFDKDFVEAFSIV